MSLKSSNPARHAPANPKLGAAIVRYHGEPSRKHRAEMLECLMAGPLLLAIHELPDGFDCSETDEAQLRFVVADWQAAGRVVCGFSSPATLAAKLPAAVGLSMDPVSVLDWIVASGAEGLLLDPSGTPAFVTNDDAREILGLPNRPDTAPRSASPLDESVKSIREGIGRLLEAGATSGRATIREPRTGKAICFERIDADAVKMVLTASSLAEDERARATMLFEQLAGGVEDLPEFEADKAESPITADYQALFCGDPDRPARAGVKVFTWVFGFPPGFALEIDLPS